MALKTIMSSSSTINSSIINSKSLNISKANKSSGESAIFNFWGQKCEWIGLIVFHSGAVNQKILYHSPMEISGNSHRNFWSNGKRPKSAIFSCSEAQIPAFLGHVILSGLFLSRRRKSNMKARRQDYRLSNANCSNNRTRNRGNISPECQIKNDGMQNFDKKQADYRSRQHISLMLNTASRQCGID